ncbi:nucleotidyltransferase family protein [Candidatus Omnitrophota bacterium]
MSKIDKRPEELLIICAGSQDPTLAGGLIDAEFKWDEFITLACQKGIASRTYKFLKSNKDKIPVDQKALEELQVVHLSLQAKNSFYLEEEVRVIEAFNQGGIPVIPLKGIFLAEYLYGDIAARDESVDFDLLVKQEDKDRSRKLLEGLGYSFCQPKEIEEWLWSDCFTKPKYKAIELHWDITMMARSPERIEGLWQKAELFDREGLKYYYFKPEELLLYLCAHQVNSDSFRTLRAVCDINRLLENHADDIHWPRLISKAKSWRLSGSLYTALRLNSDFFKDRFPQEALSQLGIPKFKRFFIRTLAKKSVILSGGVRRKMLDRLLSYILLELIEASSLREYLAVFRRCLFPPRAAMGKRSYFGRLIKGAGKLLTNTPTRKNFKL